MKRLPLLLLTLTACDSATTKMMNTIEDLSMAMSGDMAVKPGADLSMKPGMDLAMASGDLATIPGSIPDPGAGNMVDSNFGDVEPNDTPAQATPLGTSAQSMLYLWVSNNTGGGTDTADYYVFKTGPTAGTFSLGFSGLCWSGGITGIDATLWKVAGGQQVLPPVDTWMSTTSCTPPSTTPNVEANTVYLLGLDIHGGAGMYFA
jgi:hypothetical protein